MNALIAITGLLGLVAIAVSPLPLLFGSDRGQITLRNGLILLATAMVLSLFTVLGV